MAGHKPLIPRTKLSLATQNLFVQRYFPQFTFRRENGAGVWRGTLQPNEVSPRYHVVIKYRVGKQPKVLVTKPQLRSDAPHRFPDGSLCLYWHKEWYWTADADMSETIVPWTALWLYFYELWLDVGEWLGPAAPHAPNQAAGRD